MAETIKKLKEKLQKLPFAFRLFLLITLLMLASIFGTLRFPPPVIEPVTPPVGVVSLLPSSSDNPAYYGTSSSAETNPSFAVSEFTSWDYGAVQSDNGKYANDTESASNGGYASVAHRFTFNVSNYNVQNFTIHWNGYYSFTGVGTLNRKDIMIKNQTSGAWIDIGDMSSSDSDFTYSVSQEDTADFISSSGLIEFGLLLVGRAQTGFPPKSITIKVYSDMAELQVSAETPPVYSVLGVSTVFAGEEATFYCKWSGEPTHWIFSWNVTGEWVNSTIHTFDSSYWSNVTYVLEVLPNTVVGYRFYANNSYGWTVAESSFTVTLSESDMTWIRLNVTDYVEKSPSSFTTVAEDLNMTSQADDWQEFDITPSLGRFIKLENFTGKDINDVEIRE